MDCPDPCLAKHIYAAIEVQHQGMHIVHAYNSSKMLNLNSKANYMYNESTKVQNAQRQICCTYTIGETPLYI